MPQIGWGHLLDWQAGSPLTSILTPGSQGHLVHPVGDESGTGPLKYRNKNNNDNNKYYFKRITQLVQN